MSYLLIFKCASLHFSITYADFTVKVSVFVRGQATRSENKQKLRGMLRILSASEGEKQVDTSF
jgi:hypothetical protein